MKTPGFKLVILYKLNQSELYWVTLIKIGVILLKWDRFMGLWSAGEAKISFSLSKKEFRFTILCSGKSFWLFGSFWLCPRSNSLMRKVDEIHYSRGKLLNVFVPPI